VIPSVGGKGLHLFTKTVGRGRETSCGTIRGKTGFQKSPLCRVIHQDYSVVKGGGILEVPFKTIKKGRLGRMKMIKGKAP